MKREETLVDQRRGRRDSLDKTIKQPLAICVCVCSFVMSATQTTTIDCSISRLRSTRESALTQYSTDSLAQSAKHVYGRMRIELFFLQQYLYFGRKHTHMRNSCLVMTADMPTRSTFKQHRSCSFFIMDGGRYTRTRKYVITSDMSV